MNMSLISIKFTCLVLILTPFSIFAKDYPEEFSEMFQPKPDVVNVSISGLSKSVDVQGIVTYDLLHLKNDLESERKLVDYLLSSLVKESAVRMIVADFYSGVKSNPKCHDSLDTCLLDMNSGEPQYTFDYDTRKLNIFISADMLNIPIEKSFYEPQFNSSALINDSNLYFNSTKLSNNINWSNKSLLALPVGWLDVNSSLITNTDDVEFNLYSGIYHYEKGSSRALGGYQGSNDIQLNTTDFLRGGADYSGFILAVASSQNLIEGNPLAQQRLNIFSPQEGVLEVYQGQKLIVTKVANAGDVSIGYDKLPRGTYTVNILLKQADNIIYQEKRQVVNNSNFSMPVDSWDYRYQFGRFDNKKYSTPDRDTNIILESNEYLQSLFTYRQSESLVVGAGITTTHDNSQVLLGARWALSNHLNLNFSSGIFVKGGQYNSANLQYNNFTLSVEKYDPSKDSTFDSLSSHLYGLDSYLKYGANYSGNLASGSYYLSYFSMEQKSSQLRTYRPINTRNDNLSFSWSKEYWGGNISVNASYNNAELNKDSFNFGLTFSKRIGSSFRSQVNAIETSEAQRLNANISYSWLDDWSSSANLGVRIDDTTIAEGGVNISGNSDAFRYDSYGYLNSEGDYTVSANIHGNQILSENGFYLTNESSQSYAYLEPRWKNEIDIDDELIYNFSRDGKVWFNEPFTIGQSKIIALPTYASVDVEIDTDSQNLLTDIKERNLISMPGTIHYLKNEVVSLDSQLFIFNDINEQPVTSVGCDSLSCKDVEHLSYGDVFRADYSSGERFDLKSDDLTCIYDETLIGSRVIEGYCLPDLKRNTLTLSISEIFYNTEATDELFYIGTFKINPSVEIILEKLKVLGVGNRSFKVNNLQYIYLFKDSIEAVNYNALIDSLSKYAIENVENVNQLYSVR